MGGTVSSLTISKGYVNSNLSEVFGLSKTTTADAAAAGALPTITFSESEIGGVLLGFGVVSGATAPSGFSLSIKDKDGLSLATCTADGRYKPTDSDSEPIAGGVTVSDAGSNTTNSAELTVTMYVAR